MCIDIYVCVCVRVCSRTRAPTVSVELAALNVPNSFNINYYLSLGNTVRVRLRARALAAAAYSFAGENRARCTSAVPPCIGIVLPAVCVSRIIRFYVRKRKFPPIFMFTIHRTYRYMLVCDRRNVQISIRDVQAMRIPDGGFVECAQNTGTRKSRK